MALMLGEQLATAAAIVDTDQVWSGVLGLGPEERLKPEAMVEELAPQVGAQIVQETMLGLRERGIVIISSPFHTAEAREWPEELAHEAGAAFSGIWLMVPAAVATSRAEERQQQFDAGRPEPRNPSLAPADPDDPIEFQYSIPPDWTRVDGHQPPRIVMGQVWDAVRGDVKPANRMDFDATRVEIGDSPPVSRKWWRQP